MHGVRKTLYVSLYERLRGRTGVMELPLSTLGMSGEVFIYSYFNARGVSRYTSAGYSAVVDDHGSRFVIVPITSSGIALVGDKGKYAMAGVQRISAIETTDTGDIRATIRFISGEISVTLVGYSSDMTVIVTAEAGRAGMPQYGIDGMFEVTVYPNKDNRAIVLFSSTHHYRGRPH